MIEEFINSGNLQFLYIKWNILPDSIILSYSVFFTWAHSIWYHLLQIKHSKALSLSLTTNLHVGQFTKSLLLVKLTIIELLSGYLLSVVAVVLVFFILLILLSTVIVVLVLLLLEFF